MNSILHITKQLKTIEDRVHFEVYKRTRRTGDLFSTTYGMCDFITAWALRRLADDGINAMHFVGINIPSREIKGRATHTSHTVGLVHEIPRRREHVIVFDYACAQYGINDKLLVDIVPREILYHRLRDIYGGGIWGPGGSWLAQLDVDTFGEYIQAIAS